VAAAVAEAPSRWQALLVGVSSYVYGDGPGFAQALNSQGEFAHTLEHNMPGLRDEDLIQLPEPRYAHEITDAVADLNTEYDTAAKAGHGRAGLLFHYCGHGMNTKGELCLAVAESRDDPVNRRRTGLPLRDLMLAVDATARRRRQVVLILDCCYSGLACEEPTAERAHLLMAVGPKVLATHDPDGIGPTHFTGALVELLRDGVPGAGPWIDLDTAFHQLEQRLVARHGEDRRPCQRPVGESGAIPLGRNRAWT
jgi:hypothetical protein